MSKPNSNKLLNLYNNNKINFIDFYKLNKDKISIKTLLKVILELNENDLFFLSKHINELKELNFIKLYKENVSYYLFYNYLSYILPSLNLTDKIEIFEYILNKINSTDYKYIVEFKINEDEVFANLFKKNKNIQIKLEFEQLIEEFSNKYGYTLLREFDFALDRKFRFDYYIYELKLGIEYEGINSLKSRHTTLTGYSKDLDKYNLATILGYKCLRYSILNYKKVKEDLESFNR